MRRAEIGVGSRKGASLVSPLDPNAHATGVVDPSIAGCTPYSTPSAGGGKPMTPTTYSINTSYNSIVHHSSEANTISMSLGVVVKSTSKLPIELQMDHNLVLVM